MINQKLIILVGVSGSGKSTFAKQYIKDNPDTVRVNRDDMRRQILGELTQDYYSKGNSNIRGKLEKHITVVQNEMIRYWLLQGFDVVADNTHLRKDDIANYITNFGYLADIFIKPIIIDIQEAVNRVIAREGEDIDTTYIALQQARLSNLPILDTPGDPQLGIYIPKKCTPKVEYNPELQNCYIFDIDGTIADCTGVRSPYDGHLLHLDKPIVEVRNILNMIDKAGIQIIYVSGREDKWKNNTVNWIAKNSFPYHHRIHMRKTGDTRKDTVVKKEIYEEYIKDKYNVLGIFDDRLSVNQAYVEQGLFVFSVNQWRKWF